MKIQIRVHTHTDPEVQLGHKIGFSSIHEFRSYQPNNLIVATANIDGFTTLNAIANVYKFNKDAIKFYVDQCNEHNVIRILRDFEVPLMLVPRTRGSTKWQKAPERYITEIIKEANHSDVKKIHFTPYSFIRNKFPENEIRSILTILLNPLVHSTLSTFIFEIDARHEKQLIDLYDGIANHLYQRRVGKPEVFHAKHFSWKPTGEVVGNLTVNEFKW